MLFPQHARERWRSRRRVEPPFGLHALPRAIPGCWRLSAPPLDALRQWLVHMPCAHLENVPGVSATRQDSSPLSGHTHCGSTQSRAGRQVWPEQRHLVWLTASRGRLGVELVRLARSRWRVEQDYRELKGALGLDHFEGRGWPGWHHHVTLVSVAHGFLTLERLQHQNRRRRPDPVAAARAAAGPACLLGRRLSAVPASRTTVATPNRTTTRSNLTEPY